MNWFKTSQNIDEIRRDEFEEGPEGDQSYTANRYFSIGQNDNHEKSYCWAYVNGRIEAHKGRTHGAIWGHEITDNTYKGWYDPIQNIVSFVFPSNPSRQTRDRVGIKMSEEDIPSVVMRELRKTFGQTFRVEVF